MKTTGALFLLGVLVVVVPIATGVSESRTFLPTTVVLGLFFVVVATLRGLLQGPTSARFAVFLWWGSLAAFVWAGQHVQVVGAAVQTSRADEGIPPAGLAFILSGALLGLSVIVGLRAYLTERARNV